MTSRKARFRDLGLAALLGAAGGFGQAPYDFPLVLLAAMVGAVMLYRRQRGAWGALFIGWAFGTGYFLHVLQWLISPFMVEADKYAWLAGPALVSLSLFMASYWALAFGAARLLSGRSWALIPCFALGEMLRAYAFTGFAWGAPSQSLVGVMGGQALAWIGPYALSIAMLAVAVVLAPSAPSTWPRRAGQGVLLIAAIAALTLRVPDADPVPDDRPVVRLIQPNIAQRDKWQPDLMEDQFRRQLDYTAAPAQEGLSAPALVIWSETAIPWTLHRAQSALDEIGAAGGEATVVLGVQRQDGARYFNSLAVLDRAGQVMQTYDKHHLVPYGEYMPLGDLMGRFGIYGLAANEGFGYSKGPGARLLDLGPLGSALPLICYEAVFAHDVNAAPSRPAFLMQLTNDAWFGRGAGPRQHLAQARMRAIEQGLPLARAANTGISAMIDPHGRILASLELNEAGFVDAPLPEPQPPTLYSRTGDAPLAALLLVLLAGGVVWERRRRAPA